MVTGGPTNSQTSELASAVSALASRDRFGIRPGLERTSELLQRLGSPHRALRGVLVAGTNGKGSVAALTEAMARAAGASTALLAKPHLMSWTERIVLDGSPVTGAAFAGLAAEVLAAAAAVADPPTQFEVLTVMGVLAAHRHGADVTVCEVGMGGRLDSTNTLDLGGCVITAIDLDHREWLGDTVAEIAAEKAGIIKSGTWVVTGETGTAGEVIAARAQALDAPLDWVGERRWHHLPGRLTAIEIDGLRVETPLAGGHQGANLALAVTAGRRLSLTDTAIVTGAAGVRWPGRLQWLPGDPPILVDGAHNPAAMRALSAALPALVGDRPLTAVFGAMVDKQISEMLAELRGVAGDRVVFTAAAGGRAADPATLSASYGGGVAVSGVASALARAAAETPAGGVILVCGSLALVGQVLAGVGPPPLAGGS